MIRRTAALAAALTLVLSGCTGDPPDTEPREGLLRVLAGSELADMEPILEQAERETGVEVAITEIGTLDGAQQVVSGKADGRHDAIWFSSNRYLSLHPGAQARLGTATTTMMSPVVLGVRRSAAARLGWDRQAPTWAQVAEAAGQGRFTFGMTSPAASNSGFSALVGVTAALSGRGSALDAAGIDAVAPRLREFFEGQRLTAGSSGWLSDAYLRRQGSGVDGLINYESVLRSLNAAGRLPEPLVIVHPRDGVVTADYPLTLLASAPGHARDAHRRLAAYLRRPDVQRRIMTQLHRRPVNPEVSAAGFAPVPAELPFPARLDAVQALLGAYYDRIRRPSRTLYVLDTSGSMQGERIEQLRTALVALTGGAAGRFERFYNREEVTLIPFNGAPQTPLSYTVPAENPAPVLARIRDTAEGLKAEGGTAIYDSLLRAYEVADRQIARDPDRFTSIVLMSDGENTEGADSADFHARFAGLPERLRGVPVFPVLFGEAAAGEMERLAGLTGGRVFDARSQSLDVVFREIRGYQ
ncbi:substrate-binding domain-containing protein [Thermomonospora cellulosilytica]|uniref:Ca-activated chloride channel family protein n=1 Tax=Thermomonospora cellulosilytica TaxID=1411118 RepID=A0A7W3R977_9ACTN|nr:substrate-binding domain-containing protein [Thermomonospora cellulosilytica]MBA9004457.1 Ca-activated chloride channel family protein [Thermomonospora cellulosilytica]